MPMIDDPFNANIDLPTINAPATAEKEHAPVENDLEEPKENAAILTIARRILSRASTPAPIIEDDPEMDGDFEINQDGYPEFRPKPGK